MEFVAFWCGDKLREAQLFQENDPAAGWRLWFVAYPKAGILVPLKEAGTIIASSFRHSRIRPTILSRAEKTSERKQIKGENVGERGRSCSFFRRGVLAENYRGIC